MECKMDISDEFNEKKFLHLRNLVSRERCAELSEYLKIESEKKGFYDAQCKKSKSIRDNPEFDKLLVDILPEIEQITGKKLFPTYAFARFYNPDEELRLHLDRDSCEISVTLTLGFEGNVWPIYMGYPSDDGTGEVIIDEIDEEALVKNISRIDMEVGDAVVYRGCEMFHWRNKYTEGKWQAQVFLHYVDANGPFKHLKYDNRKTLAVENKIGDDLTYWVYTDVLTEADCSAIIQTFSNMNAAHADVGINGEKSDVDLAVRNVRKIELPTYKGLGAVLAAVGMDANQQRWKFNIEKANQCEFLRYPAGGGRYKGHIDTFLSNLTTHQTECRKLTVLAFLNDDFKGGNFFLQMGPRKLYPPQSKGTVLVFPSFLLHGVEDVEEGERFSAVCWLVGPWFK